MREALELPLTEWRKIAQQAQHSELSDFIRQFQQDWGSMKSLCLHVVSDDERDTGHSQSVVNVEEMHRAVIESMLTKF